MSAPAHLAQSAPLNLSESGDMFVGRGRVPRNEKSMDISVPEIRVMIPSALRSLCNGPARSRTAELSLAAPDVRGLLAELARQHPQVHVRLCDERGEPRPHINVFVNNDHVRALAALDTSLTAGDVVTILPAVSGG
jgi:molybdopterin converting factor small subunit